MTQAAKQLPSMQKPPAPIQPGQLAAIEANIERRVVEKIQREEDANMPTSTEPRLSALEAQVRQIAAAQESAHQQNHQLRQSVEQVAAAQEAAQQQTTQLRQTVEQVQHQVDAQAKSFRQCLTAELQGQMSQIEALFAKNTGETRNTRMRTGE